MGHGSWVIDGTKEQGFVYAYQYPGMQRVLQAAGRLIRSEKDRGVLLLIAQRFAQRSYKNLLPPWWPPLQPVRTPNHIRTAMKHFWKPQTESPTLS
jgi:DNA excision repair protein ERCC-2